MQSSELLSHVPIVMRLSRARTAEHLGDYDLAARILGNYWRGVGCRPGVDDLDDELGAELLLRSGALTGYLGSAAQIGGAQEVALDLLTESHTVFSRLRLHERVAEVRIELATCYRRQGFFDAARAMLDGAAEMLADGDPYLRGLAAVRRVITENCAGELDEALKLLTEAEGVVNASRSQALRGRYYNEYGAVLFALCERDGVPRWAEALGMFLASRRCFESAGHLRYCAITENNIGFSLVRLGRLIEAGRHIQNAYRLAQCQDDRGQLMLIDDTHSQLLMEQERLVEAEAVSRARLEEFAGSDHYALLAENLTTHAVTLARLGRTAEAEEEFARALGTAEFMGDLRRAAHIVTLRETELCHNNVLQFRRTAERRALTFEWRVADECLRGIGIRKGAAVRFSVSDRAKDGDLVAVLTPAGRFIMLLYTEGAGRVRLEGAHPLCPIRRFARSEITILGVARPQPD